MQILGSNLAQLSVEQRNAIEQDKQRWLEANRMTDSMRPDEIRAMLARMPDGDEKEDMRRRLNAIRLNRQARIKNNKASASHSKRTG